MANVNVPILSLSTALNAIKTFIQVLSIGNQNCKTTAYADDVNVIIAVVEDSVRIKSIINTYEQASNAKLNKEKTIIMIFTGHSMTNEEAQFDLVNVVEETNILGVVFTNSFQKMCEINWQKIINYGQNRIFYDNLLNMDSVKKIRYLNIYKQRFGTLPNFCRGQKQTKIVIYIIIYNWIFPNPVVPISTKSLYDKLKLERDATP